MNPLRVGTSGAPEEELQRYAGLLVRAGFHDADALLAEVRSGIEAELPGIDADVLARAWVAGATAALRRESEGWPPVTDHDLLQAAFTECEEHDVPVLQGVPEPEAAALLDLRTARGVVWFDQPDVWRALETGVLRIGVRAGGSGDALVPVVVACLERHGLQARPAEGGVEVRARWQRRQAPPA